VKSLFVYGKTKPLAHLGSWIFRQSIIRCQGIVNSLQPVGPPKLADKAEPEEVSAGRKIPCIFLQVSIGTLFFPGCSIEFVSLPKGIWNKSENGAPRNPLIDYRLSLPLCIDPQPHIYIYKYIYIVYIYIIILLHIIYIWFYSDLEEECFPAGLPFRSFLMRSDGF